MWLLTGHSNIKRSCSPARPVPKLEVLLIGSEHDVEHYRDLYTVSTTQIAGGNWASNNDRRRLLSPLLPGWCLHVAIVDEPVVHGVGHRSEVPVKPPEDFLARCFMCDGTVLMRYVREA